MQIFQRLCDKKNWEYLDEKNPALFWRGLPKKDLMSALGDQNSDPSRSALRLLAQLPDAANELRDLTNGPVASLRTDLGKRHTFGGLLGPKDWWQMFSGLIGTTEEEEKDSRRTAVLSFMYDQGLVTLGTGNSLTFPNDVVRLLVNQTILPESKRAGVRRRLKQAGRLMSQTPLLGRIKELLPKESKGAPLTPVMTLSLFLFSYFVFLTPPLLMDHVTLGSGTFQDISDVLAFTQFSTELV